MKGYKLLIATVIFLMIANCGLLGLLWYKNQHPPMPNRPQAVFEFIKAELKLSPAQASQYDVMRKQHFELTTQLNQQLRLTRDSFFNQLSAPTINMAAVALTAKKISDNQASIDTATFYHFRRFRAILTAPQQNHFDQIINEVMHMMAAPHGPGGPPPGGGKGPNGHGPDERPMDGPGGPPAGENGPPRQEPPDGPPGGN